MLFTGFSKSINPHQAYRIKKLKRQLDRAECYEEWKSIALKIDEELGCARMGFDNSSPYFVSYKLLLHRLGLLKMIVLETYPSI